MKKVRNFILILFGFGLIIGSWLGWKYYALAFKPNVETPNGETYTFFIPSGSGQHDVSALLFDKKIIKDSSTFNALALEKNYLGANVVPGKYEITDGWTNNELINHLRAGRGRLEVNVTFNNVNSLEAIAGKVSKFIEADSLSLIELFRNQDTLSRYGFNRNTFLCMFIPNTYRMDWATDAGSFLQVIAKNYKLFWNDDRKAKAKALGMSQSDVSILASIVQAEQRGHPEERARIAGLYINRLKKGILLQSDPTVIFAVGDFSIRRVLNKHLETESPYNTYLHAGLPPGPILIPEISSIDAVLNYEKNDYIYMCAKPGYDGFHNFAKTLEQHNENAREYRKWLDKEGIR